MSEEENWRVDPWNHITSYADNPSVVPCSEPDPIVAAVMKRMSDRSREGMEKYGCTMTRTDVSTPQWIDHAIEELLDASIYLQRLKGDIENSWTLEELQEKMDELNVV
jgi:hypothetical protein